MNRLVLFTGFVSIFLSACTAATPTPTATATQNLPTPTFISTRTALPPQANLRVMAEVVNCRYGPGMVYDLVNELQQGQSARAIGRNESSTWWYIRDPGNPGGFCWVSADVTAVDGVAGELPVVQSPFATVTNATLRGEPTRIVVGCSQFPQTIFLEAEITTNGPTFVTWKWEASTGVSSENTVLVFEEAGKQVINDYYQVGVPGDYWIKLHILTPNEVAQQVNIPVSCSQ